MTRSSVLSWIIPVTTWIVVIMVSAFAGKANAKLSAQYDQAMSLLNGDLINALVAEPMFDGTNIDDNLYIPQYSDTLQDYVSPAHSAKIKNELVRQNGISLLEQAAAYNDIRAALVLADIYMFGNFSVPTNYTKAVEYYHRVVEIEGNGHAYFMLGIAYSTGLFGEVEEDQARANVYYQFAMENGSINAIIALAFRNLKGIGTVMNKDLALFYYSRVAQLGMEFIESEREGDREDDTLLYNIRLVDFNGGIYGNKISESSSSIFSSTKSYRSSRSTFNEFVIDAEDHEYVDYYYKALEYYDGDYFVPKNRTKAFEIVSECVDLGQVMYGSREFRGVNDLDRVFLSRCQALLGHMYLKGFGTEKNYKLAHYWLQISSKVGNLSEAFNDLGLMYQYNLLPELGADTNTSISYYKKAINIFEYCHEARLNLAKLLLQENSNDILSSPFKKEIFQNIEEAVYSGSTEALFLYGEFLQMGLSSLSATKKTTSAVVYYKIFVERLEKYYFPQLRYAFEELRYGNFKNSLLGYLIAAEQGLENAQVSASYLLYQLQPLYLRKNRKSFTNSRVRSAIRYLEQASSQNNIDSTILLGDIYLNGIEEAEIAVDYSNAFAYYNKAAQYHSSHACYNLAYMYECGLVPLNNSLDYFMAKRYYDKSLQYREEHEYQTKSVLNKVAIHWALLRLRLKYLFFKNKFKNQSIYDGATGWLNTMKKIGDDEKIQDQTANSKNNRANSRASSHHEGNSYLVEEEYDIGDYLVIFLTLLFFIIFFVQNFLRQVRRMRNNQRGDGQDQQEGQPENGWNRGQFNFRGGNVEFHFFAI
ncbi:uncharacterized protein PRCAT00001022001 [Priceomyces carsonii]|uniref:uncharacterized protein n=1 Tax=Priceomyces carsonii TaxID=28549 RepID=UPI002EDA222B|nr:unnamed protein product [Priceomyces carsonii]